MERSLPYPERLKPPCGISLTSVKWVLIQVQPYCRRAATAIAFDASCVQTDEASPYSESFAHSIACSASVNRVTDTTGPNTSLCTISSVCMDPATTVGS